MNETENIDEGSERQNDRKAETKRMREEGRK